MVMEFTFALEFTFSSQHVLIATKFPLFVPKQLHLVDKANPAIYTL